MKTINKSIKTIALLLACFAIPSLADAQVLKNTFFNIDWQVNSPVGNGFADKISGWGANFEGGYFVTDNFGIGAFISYHTNNKYIGRETLHLSSTSSVTSDQQHSIFQLPFGAVARYSFNRDGVLEPYVAAKLGAVYSETSSYMNFLKIYDDSWGFFISPEIGLNIFVTSNFGFHIAAYYSYATNHSSVLTYSMDGINNLGFRVGIAF